MAEAEGGLEGGPLGRANEGPTGSGEGAQAVTFADKVGDTDRERGGEKGCVHLGRGEVGN